MDTNEEKKGIQSVETGFFIVKAISTAEEPLSITDLSKKCNMSKAQLHRYLISLCRIGVLEKNNDLRYSLGNELTIIGLKAMKNVDIRLKALPYIKRLNESLDETVALAIWIEKKGPIFISWEESKRPINVNVRIGSTVPLTLSATGNVFAAFYDKEKTQPLIEKELEENKLNQSEFEKQISQVKAEGIGRAHQYLPGISAISAPVFDQKKDLVAALNVIGLSNVVDFSMNSAAVKELIKTAEELSRELGYIFS